MSTAESIIEKAMRKANVLRTGITTPANLLDNGLADLNDILSLFSAKDYLIPYRTKETFSIATSKNKYTMGSGGDFDTDRPVKIEEILVTYSGIDYRIRELALSNYNAVSVKSIGVTPEFFYYEPAFPLAFIYFNSSPSTSDTCTIDSLKEFTEFATLATDITLPPGIELMLWSNLCLLICADNGKSPPSVVVSLAMDSMSTALEQAMKNRKDFAHADPALVTRGGYNILTDQ